ncbi:MarR family winged helix-turn-helix transcriptional regulator [Dyadobacter sp. CY356]|uniref:MarR family winged helix-turn-helix transcriptional regulator n=1 Tax=Dyadobacter sp. CY356 TaxID=2906442 RepID=UPI001F44CB66|nr:MarR family transcriptional regulator [Dyadobacter sp. CY356]MCF0055080.1 MarR family transcriptional regulator [Dyadobacter sp. CY356]
MNIGLKMGELIKSIGKRIDEALSGDETPLSMEYFFLLNILYGRDDIIQHDLANIMKKDKSGVLRQIDVLEKLNLVVRVPDNEDRRRKAIVLTPAGVKKVETFRQIEADIFNGLLEDISSEDLEVFSSVLDKMKSKVS